MPQAPWTLPVGSFFSCSAPSTPWVIGFQGKIFRFHLCHLFKIYALLHILPQFLHHPDVNVSLQKSSTNLLELRKNSTLGKTVLNDVTLRRALRTSSLMTGAALKLWRAAVIFRPRSAKTILDQVWSCACVFRWSTLNKDPLLLHNTVVSKSSIQEHFLVESFVEKCH